MILGRQADLVLAAFTAVLNAVILIAKQVNPGGIAAALTAETITSINIAAAAIIALVASRPPTVNEGDQVNVVTANDEPNKTITV